MKKKPAKRALPRPASIFRPPANPANWRPSPVQMEIYTAITRGRAYWQEAKRLRTTIEQVRALCRRIDEYRVEQSMRDVRQIRERHEAILEELFVTALESFEASKNPEVSKEVSTSPGDGDKKQATKSTKERTVTRAAGNPAFLSIAKECLADIRELRGANKRISDDPIDPAKLDDEQRVGGIPKVILIEKKIRTLEVLLENIKGPAN